MSSRPSLGRIARASLGFGAALTALLSPARAELPRNLPRDLSKLSVGSIRLDEKIAFRLVDRL